MHHRGAASFESPGPQNDDKEGYEETLSVSNVDDGSFDEVIVKN